MSSWLCRSVGSNESSSKRPRLELQESQVQTVSSVSLPQDMLLNLYFSGIPTGVVKGVVSNPLFQIFLDPALDSVCVGIEIDISQRKTETAASPLHRMDSCSDSDRVLCTRNEYEDSDSDVLLSVEQPPRKYFLIAFHTLECFTM